MAPMFGAREFAQMRRVAADAVVWGLPVVLSDLVARAHPVNGRFFELPANIRTLAPGLIATHGDIWSCSAILDVSTRPAVIALPSCHGAYLALILHDGWGRVLASLGPPEHCREERMLTVVGPSWRGGLHPDVTEVRAPGDLVWAVCHILGAGEGGRQDALRLREGIVLHSNDGRAVASDAEPLDLTGRRSFDDVLDVMGPATFFWRLARLMSVHKPPAEDADMVTALRKIGISGQHFSSRDWPVDQIQAIDEGFEEGMRRVRWATPPPSGFATCGGWTKTPAGIRHRGDALERSAAALGGLGAPPADEVLVFTTTTDAAGQPLTGACEYRLAFEPGEAPPAAAFWSICVIDQRGAPLDAPFARLSVGDWFGLTPTPGERLEISIQLGGEAGPRHRLQPPPAPFGLRLELYRPGRAALGQAWRPPVVVNRGRCLVHANVSFSAARFAASAAQPTRIGAGPAVVHFLS
jgi:hypothetical protein